MTWSVQWQVHCTDRCPICDRGHIELSDRLKPVFALFLSPRRCMILAKVTKSIRHALEEHRNPLWSGGHSSALGGCRDGYRSGHPGFVDGRSELLQPLLPQCAFLAQEYRPGAVCGTGAADSLALVHAASCPSAQSQALGEDQRCAGAC